MAIIRISIQMQGRGEPLSVRVTDSAPLGRILPEIIKQSRGYLPDTVALILRLLPDRTLAEYGIHDGATIDAIEDRPFVEVEPLQGG